MEKYDARGMFFKYGGNRGLMASDGVLQQYLEYNVPATVEFAWTGELLATLVSHFETLGIVDDEFIKLVGLIRSLGRCDVFEGMISMVAAKWSSLDDFTKILALELAVDAFRGLRPGAWDSEFKRKNVVDVLVGLSNSLSDGQYVVDLYYRSKPHLMFILSDTCLSGRIKSLRGKVSALK